MTSFRSRPGQGDGGNRQPHRGDRRAPWEQVSRVRLPRQPGTSVDRGHASAAEGRRSAIPRGVRRRAGVRLGGNARRRCNGSRYRSGRRPWPRRFRRSAAGSMHRIGRIRHAGSAASSLQAERYRTATRCLSTSPRPTTSTRPCSAHSRACFGASGCSSFRPVRLRPCRLRCSSRSGRQRQSRPTPRHMSAPLGSSGGMPSPSCPRLPASGPCAGLPGRAGQRADTPAFGNPLLLGPDGNDHSAALKQACPTGPSGRGNARRGAGDAGCQDGKACPRRPRRRG